MNSKNKIIIGQKGVSYGLQVPKGKEPSKAKAKPSIFGNHDDEDELVMDRNAAVRAQQGVKRGDAKIKKMQAEALMEDANCFDYDSFHDEIQQQREKQKIDASKSESAGPKYLTAMMAARDQRQRVRDIIFEKKEAFTAKADAELYGEKEQFATAAYKRKIEEDKRFAEELAAKDKADEGRTVEAQGMDGFLGVIQSAMAQRPVEADGAEAASAEDAVEAAGSHKPPADSFEAMMAKKARHKLEQKMAEMDKYELKRFQLEQGILQAPEAREGGAAVQQQNGAGDSSPTEPASGSQKPGSENQQDAGSQSTAERKRAAQEKIEAARARAKERKLNRG